MSGNDEMQHGLQAAVPILSWEDSDVHRRRLLHARRAELIERDRRIGLEGEVKTLHLQIDSLRDDLRSLLKKLQESETRAEDAEVTLRAIYLSRRWRAWSRLDRLRR